ncbi:hypothetical protein H072_1685 [Dactylellina haptotyla CBS 200.50]|uniref:Secreted protein n=1 Tax=Dactylellina haptotyla (strain CBS 200.50) TaxID=1284197 RepID=S8C9G4_DACHA|nr:hypothetical protein H072_1685 [Dactylellina haptotyla CBS 200.50]
MPQRSRFLAVAVSALLVSSAWATHIDLRGTENDASGLSSHLESGRLPKLQSKLFKRQNEIPLDQGQEIVSGGDTSQVQADDQAVNNDIQQGTSDAQVVQDAGQVAQDADNMLQDANSQETADQGAQLGDMTATADEIKNEKDGNSVLETAQSVIEQATEAAVNSDPVTQVELVNAAEDLQVISAMLSEMPDPATVDVSGKVNGQIEDLRGKSHEECLDLAKTLLYENEAKDLQMQTVVQSLVPVLTGVVNGTITSPATADLDHPDMAIVNASDVVDANSELAQRLRKRGELDKRFLGAAAAGLFGWLGVGLQFKAEVNTPLGNIGVGLALGASKLTDSPPSTAKEPTVVVIEKAAVPVTVNVISSQPQQPQQQPQQIDQQGWNQNQGFPQQIEYSSQQPNPTVLGWNQNNNGRNQDFPYNGNNAFNTGRGTRQPRNRNYKIRKFKF